MSSRPLGLVQYGLCLLVLRRYQAAGATKKRETANAAIQTVLRNKVRNVIGEKNQPARLG
jgi:hypothetical protein